MSTFNGKTVKQVSFSPVQKAGAINDTKAVIVVFEDDTQLVVNNGVTALNNQATAITAQITQSTGRLQEINDLKTAIAAIPA